MDMNVSPDLEAFCCYGVVLVLGLVAARAQIGKRLVNLPSRWIMVNTWLLFFAYTLVPVVLFWFLDRTNALHDTSLFAAVLVGVGYQQILTGKIGSIQAPGQVSSFWQPFGAWADNISDRIRDRVQVNSSRFDERLLKLIRMDKEKFASLKEVTLVHANIPGDVDKALQDIAAQKAILEDAGVIAKQSSLLYESLKKSSPQNFEYLLYKNGIIPPRWYWWYAKEWRSKTAGTVVAAVLATAGIAGAIYYLKDPGRHAGYYVWRMRKDNASDYDRFRAQRHLAKYLSTTPETYRLLAAALSAPNLPVKTADSILGLIIETQSPTSKSIDFGLFGEALRAESFETRLHVQRTLLYIAGLHGVKVPDELKSWQPDPKDTQTDIDKVIKQWYQVR